MAHDPPDVLLVFARRYRSSLAGKTGSHANDFTLDYRELLKAAHAGDGEALVEAERRLREIADRSGGKLSLDVHRRDPRVIHRVRLAREGGEAWLFSSLNEVSPTEGRIAMASAIASHAQAKVPEEWRERWAQWIATHVEAARCGGPVQPLERDDLPLTHELLTLLERLLAWPEKSLIRFASCVLCGDSKRLQFLQGRLESALKQLSCGALTTLEDLGLTENPRTVRLCGPLTLVFPEGAVDLGLLKGTTAISEEDLRRATAIECHAARVLTVENETTFTELVKRAGDTLLIQTSYPGRAVLALFSRLPVSMECWHFGDTDPSGFDILRDLRAGTGRVIQPLHMRYRPHAASGKLDTPRRQVVERLLQDDLMRDCHAELNAMLAADALGRFEQETLGLPTLPAWPFYEKRG